MPCNGFLSNGQDSLVQPLLTDYYQITMCYGYWKAGIHNEHSVFDLFFRKNPFSGEYTIFAGMEDCLRFIQNFRFSESDLRFMRRVLPETVEPAFFQYLGTLDCSEVAGSRIQLLEFGLRRAQGPNGGLSASKYCYIGGFDGTSNLLAGKLFGIPVRGTQAHSFICSFSGADDLKVSLLFFYIRIRIMACLILQIRKIKDASGMHEVDLFELSERKLGMLMEKCKWGVSRGEVSEGELCAFVAYAISFPTTFLALIDTYDVLRSGVINFCAVTLALYDVGFKSLGCRIDSGDLSYLSKEVARKSSNAKRDQSLDWFAKLMIVASNDINEDTIVSLNEQQHEIDAFGVGTHLVTCQKQPALGCVFKGYGICDLMTLEDEPKPIENEPILCRHPFLCCEDCSNEPFTVYCQFQEGKRALVIAKKVEDLQLPFWGDGQILQVSVTEKLYEFLHSIWLQNAPIGQLE
uniref:Nicotinate phosphoribosyltransferase n=1 Tax=Parascaris equorum TaxID=6256 RepID=A0A914RM32_PAREQ